MKPNYSAPSASTLRPLAIMLIIIILLPTGLVSCSHRTTHKTSGNSEITVNTDTTSMVKERITDRVVTVHDSITVADSVFVYVVGDTVRIREVHYRDRWHDSKRQAETHAADSLVKNQRQEARSEKHSDTVVEKERPGQIVLWPLMTIGVIALILALYYMRNKK
ncbi:MAG: hypothetical protein K2M87_01655 [Muribaculaceae bacterium]|nr:hypothetical protein [Muribaculaceae bacterium]